MFDILFEKTFIIVFIQYHFFLLSDFKINFITKELGSSLWASCSGRRQGGLGFWEQAVPLQEVQHCGWAIGQELGLPASCAPH